MNTRNSYLVIDPVLDRFDHEAPGITEKKDYGMNGIPIQYLNGLGCNDCGGNPKSTNGLMGFGSEFDGLGITLYIPDGMPASRMTHSQGRMQPHKIQHPHTVHPHALHPTDPRTSAAIYHDFMRRNKRHLINTRHIIAKHPHKVARCYKPRVLLGMIDELIGAWDNEEQREATLDKLSSTEQNALVNGMNGLGALGGFFDKMKKIGGQLKDGVKNGAKWVGSTALKLAKVVLKYNPLLVTARLGFRAAMHLNFGYLANRAYWGYFTQQEAKAKNVSAEYWNKAKTLQGKMEHVFVNILQGNGSTLRNDVLAGGAKRSANGNLSGGLGIAVEASITAAMAFLIPLINMAKGIFGGKGGGEDSGNPLDKADNVDAAAATPPMADNTDKNAAGDETQGTPDNPSEGDKKKPAKSFIPGIDNKKLLLYGGIAAAAVTALVLYNKSKAGNSPAQALFPAQPQPVPVPQQPYVPQPQYAPAMAGVKRKRKAAEHTSKKKALKIIHLS